MTPSRVLTENRETLVIKPLYTSVHNNVKNVSGLNISLFEVCEVSNTEI